MPRPCDLQEHNPAPYKGRRQAQGSYLTQRQAKDETIGEGRRSAQKRFHGLEGKLQDLALQHKVKPYKGESLKGVS